MISRHYDYAIREASLALAHLTTPEWGDTMARDPRGNRREHLERARLGFKYAMGQVEQEIARLDKIEATKAASDRAAEAVRAIRAQEGAERCPCPNMGCVVDIRNHAFEACRDESGNVLPA